jgi:hypothetical protein
MDLRNQQAKVETVATKTEVKPIPIVDAGSILSTKLWSPMLNDAFIMSGVHRGYDFYLALSGQDATDFDDTAAPTGDAKALWLKYFQKYPGGIWASTGNPRVLMRELLGLKMFGYKPQFDKRQLLFKLTNRATADGASLEKYIGKLNALGFHEAGKKQSLFAEIAEFLFDDLKALDVAAKG